MTRKNVSDDYSHLQQENSASDRSQGIVNNVIIEGVIDKSLN